MKKFAWGLAALIALAAPAAAAGAPPVYDWSGIYIGVNGGWAKSRNCWDALLGPFVFPEGCHNATGGFAGGQVGYRWQFQSWVIGAEAQGAWADLRGSNVSEFIPIFTNESRVVGLGLLTGQIGYAVNNLLLYAKGGAAVTRTRYSVTAGGALAATAPDQTRWGGALGGGIEYGFLPNWSVSVEYDHAFLPNKVATFTDTTGVFFGTERLHQNVNLAMFRLNYHWPVH